MSSNHPGWVFYKDFANSEEQGICLLKEDAPPLRRPAVVKPPGLDLKRQNYLYESIREFCTENTKDITCPKPATGKVSRPSPCPAKRRKTEM